MMFSCGRTILLVVIIFQCLENTHLQSFDLFITKQTAIIKVLKYMNCLLKSTTNSIARIICITIP